MYTDVYKIRKDMYTTVIIQSKQWDFAVHV